MAKASRSANRARRQAAGKAAVATAAAPSTVPAYLTAVLLFAAGLILALAAYGPALNGEFVFDDRNLPMLYPNASAVPFLKWLGIRPLLMATYYLNFRASGLDTLSYHVINVLLHTGCAVLIFFVLRRVLDLARIPGSRALPTTLFGAALFLLHPIQTEAVTYIASRSETLSVFFFLAAFATFLYRPQPAIGWARVLAILLLYGCAMTSKEHTAVLPAVFLLTDYFWNPGFAFSGIRRNWKLYAPIALGAAAGLVFFASYVTAKANIGFGLKDFTWYQYLFTQFRAIFVYLRLLVLPYNQSVDYNFPVSFSLFDRGAIFFGIALLAILVAAVVYRKRFPLASYGILLTAILLAPTSSIVPIHDTLVERRLYLPFIGVLLFLCEWLVRLPWDIPARRRAIAAGLAVVCLVFAVLTWRRNTVWVGMDSLWQDTLSKDPSNTRALMGIGDAFAMRGACREALGYFERAAKIHADYHSVYNVASALDCTNNLDGAFRGYQNALAIKSTPEAWVHLGLIQMKKGAYNDAYASFDKAQRLDAGYTLTYIYRGILDLAEGNFGSAEAQFFNAKSLDPTNQLAIRGLDRALKHVRQF